jgi:hypothetical protein
MRNIDHAIRLIEALNREKERFARACTVDEQFDAPWVTIAEMRERDWRENIQPIIEDIRAILDTLRGPIIAYWPNPHRFRWHTFRDMVADGKDNYEKWKASGWPDLHIQALRAVSHALASDTEPGSAGGTTKKAGKGGRKPLCKKEAERRQETIKAWNQARDSGICKCDFCEDRQITIAYLDKCLDWNRHK